METTIIEINIPPKNDLRFENENGFVSISQMARILDRRGCEIAIGIILSLVDDFFARINFQAGEITLSELLMAVKLQFFPRGILLCQNGHSRKLPDK